MTAFRRELKRIVGKSEDAYLFCQMNSSAPQC